MTEADLCDAFAVWARGHGWTVYPEVDGWDMVLTRESEPMEEESATLPYKFEWKPDDQIGIHAKLQPNCDVLCQAMGRGPRYRAVLVRRAGLPFRHVSRTLNLGTIVYQQSKKGYGINQWFQEWQFESQRKPWTEDVLTANLALPSVAADLPAGVPSPRTLSPWREKALRMMIRLRAGEKVTRKQIKDAGMDPNLWVDRWLRLDGKIPNPVSGRMVSQYDLKPDAKKTPDVGYEAVLKQIQELPE